VRCLGFFIKDRFKEKGRFMLVSHEVPLCLLQQSREFNDYDFALVHLFEKYPEYYAFFEESLAMGRAVMLDNSIFELGKAFDSDRYAYWIQKLKPTIYIIPDVFNDGLMTIKSTKEFIRKYPNLPGKRMGVLQGNSLSDFYQCYREIEPICDMMGLSFGLKYYSDFNKEFPTDVARMIGRQALISGLLHYKTINKNKEHHLLGCSLPQEFSYYNRPEFDFIKTVDTSSPVVHALLGISYKHYGLDNKKELKLADLIETKQSDINMELIQYNANMFKKIIGR
jgi:hypothetical protein